MDYRGEQSQTFFFFPHSCRDFPHYCFSQYLSKGRVYWALSWNIVGGGACRLHTTSLVNIPFMKESQKSQVVDNFYPLILPFEASEYSGIEEWGSK